MQITELYELYKQYSSIQTDTRKIKTGDLYFALKGENFNGNNFADEALTKGACFAIVDEIVGETSNKKIKVDDVLQTMQQLAKHHRQQFNIPFIAVTGSNGKTTTKELIHVVLSSTYKTYTTEGNLNNHIGIPLTILKIKDDAEIAVIEMGANHQKEIEGYCKYTLPTHGIITNCGKAHLEGFGGIEGVIKGKGELFEYLKLNNGTAFVMWDYDYLHQLSSGIHTVIKYGTIADCEIVGNVKDAAGLLEVQFEKGAAFENINTHLVGSYNLPNILAAVSIGKYFNVPDDKIKASIEKYIPSNSRSQLIEKGTNKIIIDAYNANPSSMKLAIENFAKMEGSNKVLVIGGMMELGDESIAEHQAIIEVIKQHSWKAVALTGGHFAKTNHPFIYFDNSNETKEWFVNQHFINTQILVKGSRSTKMEKVIE